MPIDPARLDMLSALARKALWLSSWTIHHANHIRPNTDGLKVGGHQASSASLATIMSALYFSVLRPEDRVAVKPHASPVFHAIQYLFGRQSREKLENFRGFKGAQSYPSRTKDVDDVDFSTGSVGLGVAQTLFASLVQDYVKAHGWMKDRREGRMIALVGDAEMDEGNIFEALLEGWKHGLRNTWWVVDYNRQSLDAVVREGLWEKFETMFRNFGWDVVIVKYGRLMRAAFAEPGGEALQRWIDNCPNALYAALCFQGGAAFRKHLHDEIGDQGAGHAADRQAQRRRAAGADVQSRRPRHGEHAGGVRGHRPRPPGLLHRLHHQGRRPAVPGPQGQPRRPDDGRADGEVARARRTSGPAMNGTSSRACRRTPAELEAFLARRAVQPRGPPPPDRAGHRGAAAARVQAGRRRCRRSRALASCSTRLARGDSELAARIVTTSPDVTVSTNLGAWVNRRGLFARAEKADLFRSEKIPRPSTGTSRRRASIIELGIAENNLFILLSALGLSHRSTARGCCRSARSTIPSSSAASMR